MTCTFGSVSRQMMVAAVLALAPLPVAARTPTPIAKGPSVEGITEYRLPNGLRVLLFPDPGKPTITVNITYLVGSRHENYGETGMAHLLEHMLFKGTPKHPDIPKELTERGARSNGQTSFDRTNYHETFEATDQNLRWALSLEADRMVNSYVGINPKLAAEILKKEMTVVRNEFESGENSPGGVLYKRLLAAAFDWHNYGKLPIGARSDIENVDIHRLSAFFRTYYQPDNAVLLVAGRIEEAKTLRMVQETFGRLPKPARKLPVTYTQEPVQDGERQVVVRRSGDLQIALAGYHLPPGSDPDFAPLSVLAQILGDTPSGRLHKALVETKKAVAAFAHPLQQREPSFLVLGLQADARADLEEAKQSLVKTVEDPAAMAYTTEEVNRAKQQLLKEVDMVLNDAERLGTVLSDYIAMGDWRLFFLERDRLDKVTPDDVARVAKAYLKPSNRTLALFIPTKEADRAVIPPIQNIEAMLKDYTGKEAVSQGEAFDTAPMAIEARTVRFTAPNGLRAAVVPKKTRGGAVHFRLVLRMGDEKSLSGKPALGEMTAGMLLRGTTKRSRTQLSDRLDALKSKLRVDGFAEAVVVAGESRKEHLAEVLDLVAELLREPGFPTDEFELLKREYLAGIELQRTDPTAIAELAFKRTLSAYPAGHPRYVATLDEEAAAVQKVTVADLKVFHQTFYGASFAELSVVGDVDPAALQARIGALFDGWRSPTPYVRMARQTKDVSPTELVFRTPDKANAFFIGGLNLSLQVTDPDYPAMVLGDFLMGGGFLNSRFATRLRQQEGLSYSVGSDLDVAAREKAGTWLAYAIHAPQNAERLETAFREEFARILKDGFADAEIRSAKQGWRQQQQLARANDRELTAILAVNLDVRRTLAYARDLEQKVEALSGQEVLTALRKYLDPSRLTVVKAGDFQAKP